MPAHSATPNAYRTTRTRFSLPFQQRWIVDRSRLKRWKSRQIGVSWSTSYGCVERTAAAGARDDQWCQP